MSVDSYYLNPLLKIPTYQPVIIKLLGAGILYSVAGFISCGPPSYFRHLRAERCKINQQLSYLGRVVGLHKNDCFYTCGSQGTSCKKLCPPTKCHSWVLKIDFNSGCTSRDRTSICICCYASRNTLQNASRYVLMILASGDGHMSEPRRWLLACIIFARCLTCYMGRWCVFVQTLQYSF